MKYIFIVNPIAGNDDQDKVFSKIKSAFRATDDEMKIIETHYQGDAAVIAAQCAEEYGDKCIVVSCGGDGTVHEIANGLAGTDTPMLILPLGTGNDFAKKIYNTKKIDVENIIKAFGFYNGKIKYKIKPIDLIDYNGEKCINIMSYGLDTKVETIGRKIAEKVPALGHQSYNIAIFPVLLQSMKYKINFELDCIDKDGNPYKYIKTPMEYTLFAICNASYYGGGFCPAPNSKLDDGLLDFALCHPVKLYNAPALIPKYSAGKTDEIKQMELGYVVGGRIWSDDGKALLGNCDGENFDYSEIIFKVEEKALKLCFIDE